MPQQPTGAIFDLDGVITDTAVIHFKAWKETFDSLLQELNGDDFRPFEHDRDYVPYVDGRPRYDGVSGFLSSRHIDFPYGKPDDPPDAHTICGVGNKKNARFLELVEGGEIPVFDTTVALVDALRDAGVRCGVASSSRNCRLVLRQTGLMDRFETVVDGTDSKELGLSGKPAPDIFVTACERLEVTPEQSMMVEDAYSGVEAGRNGGFGLVLGVARKGETSGLKERGADLVVSDLGETSLRDIQQWFAEKKS
jgi:beta-phosphoglucomutase family hydrolase